MSETACLYCCLFHRMPHDFQLVVHCKTYVFGNDDVILFVW